MFSYLYISILACIYCGEKDLYVINDNALYNCSDFHTSFSICQIQAVKAYTTYKHIAKEWVQFTTEDLIA